LRCGDAQRQLLVVAQCLEALDGAMAGVAVRDRSQADGVVILEELQEPLGAIEFRRLSAAARLALHEARATAEDAGRFTVFVLLDVAGAAVGNLEIPVDLARLERESIERRIRARGEDDRMLRRRLVQLLTRRIALLFQPGDEDLAEANPLPRRHLR